MGFEVKISGAEQIKHLADLFKQLDTEGLGKQMAKALTAAVKPLGASITEEAGKTSPSGYAETLTRSMKHRRTVRNTAKQASVRITTTAKGEKESRDIVRFNAGELRHPVHGRYRRLKSGGLMKNPWATTRVRAGFHDRGTKNAQAEAEKQLQDVIDHYTDMITGG